MSVVPTHTSSDGPIVLIVVFGVLLVLAVAVLLRPQLEWKLLRLRLADPGLDEGTRAWRAAIRAVAFLVAAVSVVFLIYGISRL